MDISNQKGFTLIELVMAILLLAVLAAVAIPNFVDFRSDAKNAATHGALGALRSAMAIATAAIQLKEDAATLSPKYPVALEVQSNQFSSVYHPVLSGTYIMDFSEGIPKNPWSLSTLPAYEMSSIIDCNTLTKSFINSTSGWDYRGWCYKQTSGEFWANSNLNAGGPGKTENEY